MRYRYALKICHHLANKEKIEQLIYLCLPLVRLLRLQISRVLILLYLMQLPQTIFNNNNKTIICLNTISETVSILERKIFRLGEQVTDCLSKTHVQRSNVFCMPVQTKRVTTVNLKAVTVSWRSLRLILLVGNKFQKNRPIFYPLYDKIFLARISNRIKLLEILKLKSMQLQHWHRLLLKVKISAF